MSGDRRDAIRHHGEHGQHHAATAAMLEIDEDYIHASGLGGARSDVKKSLMWTPPAPTSGIKDVVLSPQPNRAERSPLRLHDLIQPEEGSKAHRQYNPGASEFRQAENFHWGTSGSARNERRAKKWAEAAAR
eukprot:COSAG06_NODE_1538_length_9150_cov_102.886200_10_plen_132_part_00